MPDYTMFAKNWVKLLSRDRLPGIATKVRMGGSLKRYSAGGPYDPFYQGNDRSFPESNSQVRLPGLGDTRRGIALLRRGGNLRKYGLGTESLQFNKPAVSDELSQTPTFRSGALHNDFNEARADQSEPQQKSSFDWAGAATDVAPYATNVLNAFRQLPGPPTLVQQSYIRPVLGNFSASRNSISRYLRQQQYNNNLNIGNKVGAAAASAAAMGQAIEGQNQVTQQEQNFNAQQKGQANAINANIEFGNVGRLNEFNKEKVAKQIAQQNLRYENVANASDKFQLQRRDKAQIALENRKIDLLPKLYEDTGVFDRNLLDEQSAERSSLRRGYRRLRKKEDGGPISIDKYQDNSNEYSKGGSIHIKPSHRGRFTAFKKRTGETTEEALHSKSPSVRKMANFAKNAASWHH